MPQLLLPRRASGESGNEAFLDDLKRRNLNARFVISSSTLAREVDCELVCLDKATYERFNPILQKASLKLPSWVVEWSGKNVLFVAPPVDRCMAVSKNSWKDKEGIVILCDALAYMSEEQQVLNIAHEIAHIYLKHEGNYDPLAPMSEEELKDESEAEDTAEEWGSVK